MNDSSFTVRSQQLVAYLVFDVTSCEGRSQETSLEAQTAARVPTVLAVVDLAFQGTVNRPCASNLKDECLASSTDGLPHPSLGSTALPLCLLCARVNARRVARGISQQGSVTCTTSGWVGVVAARAE